ncbi:pksJ, partial [Symbiodinium sp. CCMP2592]
MEELLPSTLQCGPAGTTQPLPVELFDALASAQPERDAVCSDDPAHGSWTLATLRRRARLLASAILSRLRADQRPLDDALVAVCLPRGPALPVALLAVWYAGAAYVPLEPSQPVARLRFLLEDSQARLLIAERRTEPKDLAAFSSATLRLLWPSGELEEDSKAPFPEPAAEAPGDLAYVIYTSGSTGKPKGVRVATGAVTNVLHAFEDMVRKGAASEDDVLVAVTTFCFDISVLEMFWPLCYGFRLVLCSAATARSGRSLEALLSSRRPEPRQGRLIFQATPTSFRSLLQAGWKGGENVAAVCGGEAFSGQLVLPLSQLCGAGVWNAYGPTETTIWSAAHRLRGDEVVVPIGRALPGTKLLLLPEKGSLAFLSLR